MKCTPGLFSGRIVPRGTTWTAGDGARRRRQRAIKSVPRLLAGPSKDSDQAQSAPSSSCRARPPLRPWAFCVTRLLLSTARIGRGGAFLVCRRCASGSAGSGSVQAPRARHVEGGPAGFGTTLPPLCERREEILALACWPQSAHMDRCVPLPGGRPISAMTLPVGEFRGKKVTLRSNYSSPWQRENARLLDDLAREPRRSAHAGQGTMVRRQGNGLLGPRVFAIGRPPPGAFSAARVV